ncbi:MAG: RecX family transcriptional regulator [Acholeplasmataceae bacterium]|nr:RecX family transcriptional regulator [Acholeplasmataceae bacterium]
MKIIQEIKKTKKQVYLTFTDETFMAVELDLFFKFRLKVGLTIDKVTWKQLNQENDYLYYERLGIEKLKKMQSTFMLKSFLREKGCPEPLLDKLIHSFQTKKYLDDEAYVRLYIETKKYIHGPKMIADKLKTDGVYFPLIDRLVATIDEEEVLTNTIPKKVKTYKNRSKKQALEATRIHFMRKGYTREVIEKVLFQLQPTFIFQDIENLKKAAQKYLQSYGKKKQGYDLIQTLKQKLYQKGFKMNDINTVLEEMNL